MTKYFVGIHDYELDDSLLYDTLEEAQEDLDKLEDENYKIFKVTVEECQQNS